MATKIVAILSTVFHSFLFLAIICTALTSDACSMVRRPRSVTWEAVTGLPSDVQVKKVRSVEEKDSVMSLVSSGEIDHNKSSFLYNKVQWLLVSRF